MKWERRQALLSSSLLVFVLVTFRAVGTGCSKETPTARATDTFTSSFVRLPRLGPASVVPAEWTEIEARDGLVLRLGPGYRVRNDFCWAKGEERWPGPGWLDVCVSREDPGLAEFIFHLQPAVRGDARAEPSADPEMTDIVVYDSWHAEAGSLGGRRAIVERARASGGMAGYKRQRKMSALIELEPGVFARFGGSTGDDVGYDELLTIASTVKPSSPTAPRTPRDGIE